MQCCPKQLREGDISCELPFVQTYEMRRTRLGAADAAARFVLPEELPLREVASHVPATRLEMKGALSMMDAPSARPSHFTGVQFIVCMHLTKRKLHQT